MSKMPEPESPRTRPASPFDRARVGNEPQKARNRLAVATALISITALTIFAGSRLFATKDLEFRYQLYAHANGLRKQVLPGDRINVGDSLFLKVQANQDFFLYVFNEDDAGSHYTSFPLSPSFQETRSQPENPLAGDVEHFIPGVWHSGTPMAWRIDSAANHERFYIIASKHPSEVGELIRSVFPEVSSGESAVPFDSVDSTIKDAIHRAAGSLAQPSKSRDPQDPFPKSVLSALFRERIHDPTELWFLIPLEHTTRYAAANDAR